MIIRSKVYTCLKEEEKAQYFRLIEESILLLLL